MFFIESIIVESKCGSEDCFNVTGEKNAALSPSSGQSGETDAALTNSSGQSGETQVSLEAEMYGSAGIPELIPSHGPPQQRGPAGQLNPGRPQVNGPDGGPNPQRLGQRAPKLGQIGRSKKGESIEFDIRN